METHRKARRISASIYLLCEIHNDVDHKDQHKEADRNELCPTSKERIHGTRLILGKERIRAAGNRAEALLMAFLQQYDNDDRQCEKKQNNTENNFNSTPIFYLLFKRLNANFIRSLIMIPYKAGFCNRIFCFFPAYSAVLRPY